MFFFAPASSSDTSSAPIALYVHPGSINPPFIPPTITTQQTWSYNSNNTYYYYLSPGSLAGFHGGQVLLTFFAPPSLLGTQSNVNFTLTLSPFAGMVLHHFFLVPLLFLFGFLVKKIFRFPVLFFSFFDRHYALKQFQQRFHHTTHKWRFAASLSHCRYTSIAQRGERGREEERKKREDERGGREHLSY